jgi:hypothetical protein
LVKKKGEKYECEECGLVVLVENPCECDESCELVCCGEPMKQAKPKETKEKKQPAKASK